MTSANGQPAWYFRRPSAAFPGCFARGALPSGDITRTAQAVRACRVAMIGLGLALAAAVPASLAAMPGSGGNHASPPGRAASPALASGTMPQRSLLHLVRAPAPRLPDAPQELLPPANAGRGPAETSDAPRAACLAAARRAEQVHGLPTGLMVAVALSESGLHANALSIGGQAHYPQTLAAARQMMAQAPAGRSIMAGCVQVNARVHARGSDWPLDPVRATDWAGGILRRWYMETGTWEEAIRRWHGGSASSSRQVLCRVRAKLEVTAPGTSLLQGASCGAAETMQARRNGAALLEVAEMQDQAP
ncbi:MAG: transglycosylase [Belnapia sp.]|nr:transglycosylase [Belnapia sp.]